MNQKIIFFILSIFLIVISWSSVKAEKCDLQLSPETYISLIAIDNANKIIEPIDNQYRQNDNLFIDKVHIVISNPYPDRWFCDSSNFTGFEIVIREAGSEVSKTIFNYAYFNESTNTIDISIQRENFTLTNAAYSMNNNKIMASYGPFKLNEGQEK